jgi:transposase
MKTLSEDLRERILASYDGGAGTRADVARRFRVSEAMVKKLLQQRRRTGEIGPRHRFSGRKPLIGQREKADLLRVVHRKPDSTLEEMRAAVGLDCTLPAIHYALRDLGFSYKKKRLELASKNART